MFERCYLHIGLQKTGTTAIQDSLRLNRARLAEQGFHLPSLDGADDHAALAVYARGRDVADALRTQAFGGRHADLGAFRAAIEAWADALGRAGDAPAAILSSEHIHDQVTDRAGLERLAALVRRLARAVTVIVYLRRQDRVAVSLTSAAIRQGAGIGTPLLPDIEDGLPRFYSYADIIADLDAVFGRDAVAVRIAEDDPLEGGDVVADFHAVLGIAPDPSWRPVGRVNPSLSLPAQLFLARFNEHVPAGERGDADPLRGDVDELLLAVAGPKRLPTRARAKRFVEAFAAQNAAVFDRLGRDIGRHQLFDSDFSEYPESVLDRTLSVQQSVRIAAYLWRAQAEELARLRAQVAEQAEALARLKAG